jgi:hypothetical protein
VECGTAISAEDGDPGSAATHGEQGTQYQYLWLPACTSAGPGNPLAASLTCPGSQDCATPGRFRYTLWTAAIIPGNDPFWQFGRSECRTPIIPGQQPRPLTQGDVLQAIRRIGLPTNTINGPTYTLVNLNTTFSTTPHTLHQTLTIIGYTVTIHAQPTHYTWHWDDTTTTTTTTPGRPYPHTDITHTYTHPTNQQPHHLTIDTTYQARYQVNGGPWNTITQPITTTGPTHQLPVKQAAAVLVQP